MGHLKETILVILLLNGLCLETICGNLVKKIARSKNAIKKEKPNETNQTNEIEAKGKRKRKRNYKFPNNKRKVV